MNAQPTGLFGDGHLGAFNVFDKYYYDARLEYLFSPIGTTFASVGCPREFGVRVKHDF